MMKALVLIVALLWMAEVQAQGIATINRSGTKIFVLLRTADADSSNSCRHINARLAYIITPVEAHTFRLSGVACWWRVDGGYIAVRFWGARKETLLIPAWRFSKAQP